MRGGRYFTKFRRAISRFDCRRRFARTTHIDIGLRMTFGCSSSLPRRSNRSHATAPVPPHRVCSPVNSARVRATAVHTGVSAAAQSISDDFRDREVRGQEFHSCENARTVCHRAGFSTLDNRRCPRTHDRTWPIWAEFLAKVLIKRLSEFVAAQRHHLCPLRSSEREATDGACARSVTHVASWRGTAIVALAELRTICTTFRHMSLGLP